MAESGKSAIQRDLPVRQSPTLPSRKSPGKRRGKFKESAEEDADGRSG